MRRRIASIALGAAVLAAAVAGGVRAEVIEEIVAKVNDDIITKSELETEEQLLISELYRQFTGDELTRRVNEERAKLLQNLIDRKILIHRAERLYDLDKMKEALVDNFMRQQGIKSKDELERLLSQEGVSLDELERRLVELYAPEEIIRFEVGGRLAIADAEIEAYYREHEEAFRVPAEVVFREIVLLADPAEREAQRAHAEAVRRRIVEDGEDFAEVAREVSEAPSAAEGGRIGPFQRGDLAPEIEAVVFSLPQGEVSPVIETEHGFHILEVESRTEDRVRTLDEVREEIRRKLQDQKYQVALDKFLKKAREEATVCVNPKYKSRYVLQIEDECQVSL